MSCMSVLSDDTIFHIVMERYYLVTTIMKGWNTSTKDLLYQTALINDVRVIYYWVYHLTNIDNDVTKALEED